MGSLLNKLGNQLFARCFPVYRPAYSLFKTLTDRAERKLLREHVKPGMTVVDAGANIGVYSAFLSALVGPGGKVHSFEPSAANFVRLAAYTEKAGNIVCNQMAVGSVTQEMFLYVSRALNVDHRMYPTPDEARQGVAIPCVALDDYFAEGSRVHFIKMDIQGYELAALRGAERIIQENPGLQLLVEFWPYGLKASGAEPTALPHFLTGRGFHVAKVDAGGSLIPLGRADFEIDEGIFCNLFAALGGSR
jgi:FkbM family methyltransferase